jgi:phosphoglycolate phosphatase-like HAD superfamily hydrolase
MTNDPASALKQFKPEHEFFIGIDSDGCAFDTMEVKHKECFGPNIVKHFGLASVSKMAREAFEFVNLYSKDRGCNRWIAVRKVLDYLAERPEVAERGAQVPPFKGLTAFLDSGCTLSNEGLLDFIGRNNDPALVPDLITMYDWTRDVNRTVGEIVHNVPPFPHVRECLDKAKAQADMIVVSATPNEALEREWQEHDIARYVEVIAGQEMGSKKEHLALAAKPNYAPDHILMIGDAPGDMKAARANDALFFPIGPGQEADWWQRLRDEALAKFFAGEYAGDYEAQLIREFDALLPEQPPWK